MIGYTAREMSNYLIDNGWRKSQGKGSHIKFSKEGHAPVIIPNTGKEVSRPLAQRLLKEIGIIFN